MSNTYYLKLLTSKHIDRPKFTAWLDEILTPVDEITTLLDDLYLSFGIDTAVGAQLDVMGEILNVSRNLNFQPTVASPTLDDETYRFVLKAKVAQNHWDGTIPGLYAIWASLFPTASIKVVDNQDMTCDITFVSQSFTTLQRELVAHDYVLPRPQCVSILKTFGGTFSFRSVALDGGAYVIESDLATWVDGNSWDDTQKWDENSTSGFSDVTQVSGGYFGSVS